MVRQIDGNDWIQLQETDVHFQYPTASVTFPTASRQHLKKHNYNCCGVYCCHEEKGCPYMPQEVFTLTHYISSGFPQTHLNHNVVTPLNIVTFFTVICNGYGTINLQYVVTYLWACVVYSKLYIKNFECLEKHSRK